MVLKDYIRLTHMDIEDLADSVGCNKRTLENYIARRMAPPLEIALRLFFQCDGCVSLEEMLTGPFNYKPRPVKLRKKLKCPNNPYLRDCYRLVDDPDKNI